MTIDDDESSDGDAFVEIRFNDRGGIRMPHDSWRAICRSLGRLETGYRSVCLDQYHEEEYDDPFDVFIEELREEDPESAREYCAWLERNKSTD